MRRVFNSLFRPRLGRSLHNLIWSVRREDRAPYRRLRARADVNRFLTDPQDFQASLEEPDRPGLAGRHVQLAMEAQALAFQGKPEEAAERMKDALDALPRPGALKDAQARNTAEIHALGEVFITEQRIRAGEQKPQTLMRTLDCGSSPPMTYIEYMRALHLIHAGEFDAAYDVVAEFDKLLPRLTANEQADFAVSLAALCVDLDKLTGPDAHRTLKAKLYNKGIQAFETADRKSLKPDWQTSLLYWQAAVLRCQSTLEETTNLKKAADLLDDADRLLIEAERISPSKRWSDVVEFARDGVLQQLAWLEIDHCRVGPAQKRLRGERAGTEDVRNGPALGWKWLLETWSTHQTAEAEDFVRRGLQAHAGHLVNRPDGSEGRRLVLEVSENMIVARQPGSPSASSPEAPQETENTSGNVVKPEDLLREFEGPEDARIDTPSIPGLRRYLQRTYGLTLPGVMVTYYPDFSPQGTGALLVDGTPIAEYLTREPDEVRFVEDPYLGLSREGLAVQSDKPPEERDIFEIKLESISNEADADLSALSLNRQHYAAHWLGQVIFMAYEAFVDSRQIAGLGLAHLNPRLAYTMLRVLIADRTPLHDVEALRLCAQREERHCTKKYNSDMALAALSAVKQYRALPALRSMLWGTSGHWRDLDLSDHPSGVEAQMKAHLGQFGPFIDLPKQLRKDLSALLEPERPDGFQGAEREDFISRGRNASLRAASPVSAETRVVVKDPDVRILMRASFPTLQNPIVTISERDGAAALARKRMPVEARSS